MHLNASYEHQLFDPKWIAKREKILKRDNNICQICGVIQKKLHVHHKQYHFIKRLQKHVNPWEYEDYLLITLCETCHAKGHQQYKIPTKYI